MDSGSQWREVQRKQAGESGIQQANVISSRRSGYVNSGLETESEMSYHHRNRRHRKHRSRSRSPSESKTWLPDELKKHLEFDLIDTTGMSESQLREIPYTVVQTNHAKQLKLKHLQWNKRFVDRLECQGRGTLFLLIFFHYVLRLCTEKVHLGAVSHIGAPSHLLLSDAIINRCRIRYSVPHSLLDSSLFLMPDVPNPTQPTSNITDL